MFCVNKLIAPYHRGHNLLLSRMWSGTIGTSTQTEKELIATLKSKFLKAADIQVKDISGGCGSMYDITVESIEFQGIPRMKQHQMIVDTLRDEIKDMQGVDTKQKLSKDELCKEVKNYDALIVRSDTKITDEVLAAGHINVVGRAGAGVDNIDIDAATKNKVVVLK